MPNIYLEKIESSFDLPIVAIIYDSKKEIFTEDRYYISNFLKNLNFKKALVIINNDWGGDFFTAFNIALSLKEKFSDKLQFLIPEKAASASALPLFLGSKLYMSKNSFLTPCDCYYFDENIFPYWFRACKSIKHESNEIRRKSLFFYNNSINVLKTFLNTRYSLIYFDLPKSNKEKETFLLRIIDELERKEFHDNNITFNKLKNLKFNRKKSPQLCCDWVKAI